MKRTENRQNKFWQMKDKKQMPYVGKQKKGVSPSHEMGSAHHGSGGVVYGLVRDLLFATKIAKATQSFHLVAHNFDSAASLTQHAHQKKPVMVILDWDSCEREAFILLKEFRLHDDLKHVPIVGRSSSSQSAIKKEAESAGCDRVYGKTEFDKELPHLLVRYTP